MISKNLIEEKIQAVLERAKPRDFFDIYFLLKLNLSTPKNIFPYYTKRGMLEIGS
jgi:hypothetical protein